MNELSGTSVLHHSQPIGSVAGGHRPRPPAVTPTSATFPAAPPPSPASATAPARSRDARTSATAAAAATNAAAASRAGSNSNKGRGGGVQMANEIGEKGYVLQEMNAWFFYFFE